MPEVRTVLLDVQQATSKDGSKHFHKAKLDSQTELVAIWDAKIAETAKVLVGKQVYAEVGSKVSGNFTNFTLYGIRPDGDGEVTLITTGHVKPTHPVSEGAKRAGGMDDATVLRITRLSCLSSACTLLSSAEHVGIGTADAISVAEAFVKYAFEGRHDPYDVSNG